MVMARSLVGRRGPCQQSGGSESSRGPPRWRSTGLVRHRLPWESNRVASPSRVVAALLHAPSLAVTVTAGVALASLPRGAGLPALLLGGALGAACGIWLSRGRAPSARYATPAGPVEWLAACLPLACLLPLVTMPVAPGADMAMHVALARALREGAAELSPAWPGVAPAIYPRGFSGLVALGWALGPARAGLLMSGLTYVIYAAGAARLFAAAGMTRPWLLALLALFLTKAPQQFFAWGGNPTVLAIALGLHAAALLAGDGPDRRRTAAGAALLLGGAVAVHPMGALAGGLVAAVVAVRRGRLVPGAAALAALGATLLLLAAGGPTLSPGEREWIVSWGRMHEAVLRGPAWSFPVSVWPAFPRTVGAPWTIAIALALAALVLMGRAAGRGLVSRVALGVVALGALFAGVPLIPALGTVLYPVRLVPLLPLVTAPLLDATLALAPARLAGILGVGLLALAVPLHVRWYQEGVPMATAADLAVLACADTRVPRDAVIAGAYGDATQWIPALLARRITLPHRHVSVLDETRPALDALRPTHRFIGEARRYREAFPGPDPGPVPGWAPMCQAGAARLWQLDP